MSLKAFTKLEADLGFKSVTFGDSEGWCDLSVWADALKQMETITRDEVKFSMVEKGNALEVTVNAEASFLIESPDDNFDDRIISKLNETIQQSGIADKFYLVTVHGVEFAEDPLVSIGYMNKQTYETIANLGFGNEREYDWTDDGITWKGEK